MNAPPFLTFLTRGGQRESQHRGHVVVAGADRLHFSIGNPEERVFPRSALKPFQALPLLEDGLDRSLSLTDREIALTTASHGGDELHVAVARELLRKGDVPESALLCGCHAPMDEAAARRLVHAGERYGVLHNNCSGKHAGMLIQARHLGAPLAGYIDPNHPVQQRIRARIVDFSGVPDRAIGIAVDGCSAPAFSLPLAGLARSMARFADPSGLPPPVANAAQRLFDAAMAEPHYVSGRRRFDLAVAKVSSGRAFCKIGAEGVVALALRPPRPGLPSLGIAVKVEDGNARGYALPVLALLRWLGFDPPADSAELPSGMLPTQRNYAGLEVGKIEVSELFAQLPPSPWS